jgi:hypothetical protein
MNNSEVMSPPGKFAEIPTTLLMVVEHCYSDTCQRGEVNFQRLEQ